MAYDAEARENWHRYLYAKDRGHLEFMAQAQRCEQMYLGGGEQWSEEDKQILASERRPFYEFNEIMPSCNSAIGYQIKNRMDIAFSPRGGDADLNTATTLAKVSMQVVAQEHGHWKETQVFSDGIIQQRGYFDLRVDFDTNMKGEIRIGTLDPLDVMPDPDAKTYDPDGWGDVIITRWLTLDEIEQVYGKNARAEAEKSGDDGPDHGEQEGETERNKFGHRTAIGSYDAYGNEGDGLKRYRIIDRQRWVYEKTLCMVWPQTGDIKTMADMTKEQVERALADGAVQASRMRRRIKWVVSTYCATLHSRYSPYEHFTVVPYFAYFRRGKTRGMVDNGIGPQEALNKAVSQYVHIISSAANSGWIVQQGSLTNMDVDELEQVGASTGLVIEYEKGSAEPKKIGANNVPSGVDKLIDRATQALKDVTVPDAMRGLQGNAVSGVAKQADQFASQQQLAVPLENLAFTRRLLALRLRKLIQRYYDSPRIFRIVETDPITGKEVEKELAINQFDPATGQYLNDITIGEYDVVITEQPMQATFQNSQFEQALAMRKEGVAIPDAVVVKYSSLQDKHDILATMQANQPAADPTLEAKAELMTAQAAKTRAETVSVKVESLYSGTQAALALAQNPMAATTADQLLGSAGFEDANAAPIVAQPAGGVPALAAPASNTDPLKPANPDVGLKAGIETPEADGRQPAPTT